MTLSDLAAWHDMQAQGLRNTPLVFPKDRVLCRTEGARNQRDAIQFHEAAAGLCRSLDVLEEAA